MHPYDLLLNLLVRDLSFFYSHKYLQNIREQNYRTVSIGIAIPAFSLAGYPHIWFK